MNRVSFSFLIALLIHLLFILLIYIATQSIDFETKKEEEQKIRISLKELPEQKSGIPQEKLKSLPKKTHMPKGKQLQEHIEKPYIKHESKANKEQKKLQQKASQDPIKEPQTTPMAESITPLPSKPFVPLLEEKIKPNEEQKKSKNDLYSLLSQDALDSNHKKETQSTNENNSIHQNIKELYGEEFGKLTKGQQSYILDNQEIMRRITQEVLNRVARVNLSANMNVNSTNVIEFYLHPNGDISEIKFLKKSGYYLLDDTTKETIEYAYSRYPRPSEKTLIRYNVFYNLGY